MKRLAGFLRIKALYFQFLLVSWKVGKIDHR